MFLILIIKFDNNTASSGIPRLNNNMIDRTKNQIGARHMRIKMKHVLQSGNTFFSIIDDIRQKKDG